MSKYQEEDERACVAAIAAQGFIVFGTIAALWVIGWVFG